MKVHCRWSAYGPHDLDLDACTVRVTRQISYPPGGGHSFGPPKSRAAAASSPSLTSSAERQCALANEIGKYARAALGKPESKPKRSGTRKARDGEKAS